MQAFSNARRIFLVGYPKPLCGSWNYLNNSILIFKKAVTYNRNEKFRFWIIDILSEKLFKQSFDKGKHRSVKAPEIHGDFRIKRHFKLLAVFFIHNSISLTIDL